MSGVQIILEDQTLGGHLELAPTVEFKKTVLIWLQPVTSEPQQYFVEIVRATLISRSTYDLFMSFNVDPLPILHRNVLAENIVYDYNFTFFSNKLIY